MPRRARMYIPGLPYHVVQRGNNRKACFIEDANYQHYLRLWQEVAQRYGVAVHAFCLMTNHIHFLVTPATETAISNTMKVVGSRYAQYVNRRYHRSGTLWEGRHRSSLVQSERYLLACYRYIELNPVRAHMVALPDEYRWSSYAVNGWGEAGWLQPHAEYLNLGKTPEKRCRAYRELFQSELSEIDLQLIRRAAHYCQPIGDARFRQQIEAQFGFKRGRMKRGRPRKESEQKIFPPSRL